MSSKGNLIVDLFKLIESQNNKIDLLIIKVNTLTQKVEELDNKWTTTKEKEKEEVKIAGNGALKNQLSNIASETIKNFAFNEAAAMTIIRSSVTKLNTVHLKELRFIFNIFVSILLIL
jgi:hypothetical protein